MERFSAPNKGKDMTKSQLIYALPARCGACGAAILPWLSGVRDRVHLVNGVWDLYRCSDKNCCCGYLDAALTPEQLGGFYSTYSTHSDPVLNASGAKRLFRNAIGWFIHRNLDYARPEVSSLVKTLGWLFRFFPVLYHTACSRVFWLPYKRNGKLVEIGYGNAQTLLQMRDLGWDVEGIEFDPLCIEKARAYGLRACGGDFFEQDYGDGSLDAVVGSHVIEHVPDPGRLIDAIYAKLAPGGRMVLVTPNANSLGCAVFGRNWRGLEAPRHLTIHTPGSLTSHAERAGFKTIRLFGTPLGGGILEQSHQICRGKTYGRTRRIARLGWVLAASVVYTVMPLRSEEIVLFCEK